MKKRNKFWILIGIGVSIVFLLIIVSSVISVGERLRSISQYLEYGFYGLSVILLWFLIINPLDIESYNVLCAGFPCQPFSKAGSQLGFTDEIKGTFLKGYELYQNGRPYTF